MGGSGCSWPAPRQLLLGGGAFVLPKALGVLLTNATSYLGLQDL